MPEFNSKERIRIGFLSTIYHTSFVMMCNNLIEKRLGIQTEWDLHGTGPSIIDKFLKNELDFGYIGLPPSIIGIDKGANIKCVAGGHVEGTIMVALDHFNSYHETNHNIGDVFQQFEDHVIAVPKMGSIHDVILRDWVKNLKLEGKLQIVNYDIADFILIDMQNNLVDGAVGTPALAVFLAEHLHTKTIIPPEYMWPYNPSYGIIAHNSMIEKYPELVEQFLQLHKDACKALRETPNEVARLVEAEVELLKKEFIMKTYQISPKYCAALPREFVDSTMKFVRTLRNLQYIAKNLDESDIFDFSFINKIHPEKHHYEQKINFNNKDFNAS